MANDFKVGDYVEHCSLMPGVVMAIDEDDVEIRLLNENDYDGVAFSCCSIQGCGIRKLNFEQVKMMNVLGNEKLGAIYSSLSWHDNIEDSYFEYDNKVKEAYLEMMNSK